jgi:hypothetical protein
MRSTSRTKLGRPVKRPLGSVLDEPAELVGEHCGPIKCNPRSSSPLCPWGGYVQRSPYTFEKATLGQKLGFYKNWNRCSSRKVAFYGIFISQPTFSFGVLIAASAPGWAVRTYAILMKKAFIPPRIHMRSRAH